MKRTWLKYLAVLLAIALAATACGGGSDGDDENADEGDNVETTADTGDDDEAMDEDEGDDGGDDDDDVIEAGEEAEGDVDTEVVEAEEAGKFGGDVVLGIEAEATGLRPWEDACSSPCVNMFKSVFDPLVEQRADGTYGGFLATDFTPNDDFTVWVVNLREGVTFHNGVDFNAQAVADMFPLQQEGATSGGVVSAAGIVSVEATGDNQVTYTLSSPNSALPATLARPSMHVFEVGAALELEEAFSISPVGTGAFVMDKRDLDNETVMVRNENYWNTDSEGNQLPYLDSITFRPIPDEGTRLDSLLSGTVNAMQTLRQGTIRDARDAADGLTLYEFQGNNVGGGQFNTLVAPYDDVRVRRGLTQMNNQDAVIASLGGEGISLPGSQWFSPDSPWYSEKVAEAWPQFDFAAGQATLQGYIDDPERSDGKAPGEPIEIELSCPPDPTLIAAMQVLEQLWTQSGLVTVNLTNYDQQTHINYALGGPGAEDDLSDDFVGEHGAHCWRWSSDEDPSTELNRQFLPPTPQIALDAGIVTADGTPIFSPTNFTNFWDPEIFGWLNDAIATDDFDERYALYENVMMRFAEEVPLWYSGHTATLIATEDNVVGLNSWELPDGTLGVGHPAAVGRWHQVWIDEG